MEFRADALGFRRSPPAIVVQYTVLATGKHRERSMPVRDLDEAR